MNINKNRFLRFLFLHGVVFLFIILHYVLFDGCVIKKFFGVRCPTCGVTTAWIEFLKGNFILAFQIHPYFLPLTIMFLLLVHIIPITKKLKFMEKFILLYAIVVSFATTLNYFIYL